jgi:hypothetical protein
MAEDYVGLAGCRRLVPACQAVDLCGCPSLRDSRWLVSLVIHEGGLSFENAAKGVTCSSQGSYSRLHSRLKGYMLSFFAPVLR